MVNGQTIRPKKNRGGKNGQLTGADEVQRISKIVDEYDAAIRAGENELKSRFSESL